MKKPFLLCAVFLLVLFSLASAAGCQPQSATSVTSTSTSTALTTTPAATLTPTLTSTPALTLTHTTTPSPTMTWTPTLTPTPPPWIAWATPDAPVTLSVDERTNRATYTSGGVQVSGYFYRPQGTGPFPAVLVVHGKSGLSEGVRPHLTWLAAQGYVAFAPDYFTPIGMTPEKFNVSFYRNCVDPARECLAQGLQALKSLSYVDANRLAVVGFSLGGYLSFILATRDDVKGIVSYYGAYAPTAPATYSLAEIITEIKVPVLMFHGDADQLVPIAHANTARDLLTSKGKQFEYFIYPGVGHAFDLQGAATYDANATTDARQKELTFLKAKL